jgi:hypothetical protein
MAFTIKGLSLCRANHPGAPKLFVINHLKKNKLMTDLSSHALSSFFLMTTLLMTTLSSIGGKK